MMTRKKTVQWTSEEQGGVEGEEKSERETA